jgi:hypothetical protein
VGFPLISNLLCLVLGVLWTTQRPEIRLANVLNASHGLLARNHNVSLFLSALTEHLSILQVNLQHVSHRNLIESKSGSLLREKNHNEHILLKTDMYIFEAVCPKRFKLYSL